MLITIDPDLCEGNAVCQALAPLVFDLDDAEQARILPSALGGDGEVAETHRSAVERAVGGCPRQAISIAD